MNLKLHSGPATYEEMVEFGWAPDDARQVLDDPERLIRALVEQQGWPEPLARSHVENPLLPMDLVVGAPYPPISLEESMRQPRETSASTRG